MSLILCFNTCHDQPSFIPDYAIEITKLAQVIALWAFANNHRLTFGLTSNSLQAPTAQALTPFLAILLHNPGLFKKLYLKKVRI